jgi:hypothetical protein
MVGKGHSLTSGAHVMLKFDGDSMHGRGKSWGRVVDVIMLEIEYIGR